MHNIYKIVTFLSIIKTMLMLLDKINISDPEISKKLILSPKHQYDWKYYYEHYNNALIYLTNIGNNCNYQINCRARAYLFLLRHTFELLLKYNLERNGIKPPLSHKFSDILIYYPAGIVPESIEAAINIIDKNDDGSCYKYYEEKVSNTPFWNNERLKVLNALQLYTKSSTTSDFEIRNSQIKLDTDNKALRWKFTFHMGECYGLGHIRTNYDLTIELLLKGIIRNDINVNDIYLPLLFLLRHSLEIALKFNLINSITPKSKSIESAIANEYSLCNLYNKYQKILDDNYLKLPIDLQQEYTVYKAEYERLNNILHILDFNSTYFRFPIDKQGKFNTINLSSDLLIEIFNIYYFTDSFITFTVDIMHEYDIMI